MSGVRIPVRSPNLILGISQVGKAHDFDSCMRRFESCIPSQIIYAYYDSLAQLVEHLTLNQGVPGSSPGWVTREHGEVSEWFKELVLKTSDTERYRGFESHLLRIIYLNRKSLVCTSSLNKFC